MSEQYTIKVLGTPYTVRTDAPQQQVEQAAAAVEGAMRQLLDKNPRASVTMSAIYAAIQFADDKRRAEESADHLRGQLKGYLDDLAALRSEVEALRREAAAARKIQSRPAVPAASPREEGEGDADEDGHTVGRP